STLIAPKHRPSFKSLLKVIFHGGSLKRELEVTGRKGTHRWLELHSVPLRNHKQEITAMLSVARDVTERKRADETLRELSRRIMGAQEAERRRVARELHDGVNQLLASARFRIQSVESKLSKGLPQLAQDVTLAREILVHALQEVRRISGNLRPSELDDLGLQAALRSLRSEFQARTGIEIELIFSRLPGRLVAEAESIFYRIVQEALSN